MRIFGFAHAAWFYLAHGLSQGVSALSAMLLGEVIYWQDWCAVALVMSANASVLRSARWVAKA